MGSACLVKDGRACEGDTRREMVSQIADVTFDYELYTVTVYRQYEIPSHTARISKSEFTIDEFIKEGYAYAFRVVQQYGWKYFRSV